MELENIKNSLEHMKGEKVNQIKAEVKCFQCGKTGHIKKECRSFRQPNRYPQTQGSQAPNHSYCDSSCIIHTGAKHRNKECNAQTQPCTFAPNHSSHPQGMCRRQMNAQPYNASMFQNFSMGPYQNTQQNTNTMQNQQQNTSTKAQNVHNISTNLQNMMDQFSSQLQATIQSALL